MWVCVVVGERREHRGEERELGSGELSPMIFGQEGWWNGLGACWLGRRGGGEGQVLHWLGWEKKRDEWGRRGGVGCGCLWHVGTEV